MTKLKKPTAPSHQLVEPSFLFRFSAPLYQKRQTWSETGIKLAEKHVLPSFAELNGAPIFADFRGAWNRNGLGFTLQVRKKKQSVWCRESRMDDSDGLHICLDTRDTHNIHRASRYCHRFCFLPFGGGRDQESPVAQQILINRAREMPHPVEPQQLKIRSERRIDGYLLFAHIPAAALTGYDPTEHPRLGFSYAIVDRELGWQTFYLTPEYPILEDPSLWGTLELTD